MAHLSPTDVVSVRRLHIDGFSLFEFVIAIIIFAVVMMVALDRVAYYRKEGDKAGVRALLVNMRSALSHKVLFLQAQGREAEVRTLAGANPVTWLQHPPPNYLGELDEKAAQVATPGQWYFDVNQHNLVYVLESKTSSSTDATERIYFKVESLRLPSKNANADRDTAAPVGIALNEVAR